MKIRFRVSNLVWDECKTSLEFYDFYDKNLKEYGFILDKFEEDIYIEYKRDVILDVDDLVSIIGWGITKITYKFYDVDTNIMTYEIKPI